MFLLIIFSLLGDLIALGFGAILMVKKSGAEKLARFATPFAAGALLAAAFCDLLPESAENGEINTGLIGALAGILAFFLLERGVHWFHHHRDENKISVDKDAKIPLVIIGNFLHRAIDGVAIAAGFLVSPPVGIITTLAVVAHEIPHTIGDFGLLLSKKMSRAKVLIINLVVAVFTTICAGAVFLLGENFALPLDFLLGLTAGFFIYIAVSDIIPDIHAREDKKFVGARSLLLLFGVILTTILIKLLHNFE